MPGSISPIGSSPPKINPIPYEAKPADVGSDGGGTRIFSFDTKTTDLSSDGGIPDALANAFVNEAKRGTQKHEQLIHDASGSMSQIDMLNLSVRMKEREMHMTLLKGVANTAKNTIEQVAKS